MPVRHRRTAALALLLGLIAGCDPAEPPPPTPAEIRARIVRLLPPGTRDRRGWAADMQSAFAALELEPSRSYLCAAIAVTAQESTFDADPPVAGLGRIARAEIERRATRMHVPLLVVRAALNLESPDGRTWDARIAAVRTEKQLSDLFEELIDSLPMGRRLLAHVNPVRTGGPMQVGIAFAERHARRHPYPLPVDGSIRHEVFTRRGGLYFGIAHLLGYRASYSRPLYRFADYNAGWYASRNAAFQKAVSIATGVPLALDGDLLRHGTGPDGSDVGPTEAAVRALADPLDLGHAHVRRMLQRADRQDFEDTALYRQVFELAERRAGRPLPRAVVPHIRLQSPKITRRLTTEWFATRVDGRYRSCMARGG